MTGASEICIGIVSAASFSPAPTWAARRLAPLFADLTAGISSGFSKTLTGALPDTQPVRREFLRRVRDFLRATREGDRDLLQRL